MNVELKGSPLDEIVNFVLHKNSLKEKDIFVPRQRIVTPAQQLAARGVDGDSDPTWECSHFHMAHCFYLCTQKPT